MHDWFAVPNWFDFHILESQAGLSSSRSTKPLPNALFDVIRLLVAPLPSRIPGPPLLLASLDWMVVFVTLARRMPPPEFWKALVARMVLPVEFSTTIPSRYWLTWVLRSIVLLPPKMTMPNSLKRPSPS